MAAKNFGRVNVSITASTGGLTAGLGRASKQLGGFAGSIKRIDAAATFLAATTAIRGVTAAVGSLFRAMRGAVDATVALGEEQSKSTVVFGNAAEAVAKFAKSSSAIGISETEALRATGTFGNLFRAIGLAENQSADFSISMTSLAADLASFNNTSIEDALLALGAGLRGEAEPLRRYGVLLDDATLRQHAMRMGLTATLKTALTPSIKAQAAYAAILGQTSLAQGDFVRTSGSLANQQRILQANFSTLQSQLGQAFVPLFQTLVREVMNVIPEIKAMTSQFVAFFTTVIPGTEQASSQMSSLAVTLRLITGAATMVTGVFQMAAGGIAAFGAAGALAFASITGGIGAVTEGIANLIASLPGIDLGIASAMQSAADATNELAAASFSEAGILGDAAGNLTAQGLENFANPLAAFDKNMKSVEAGMQNAAASAGQSLGASAAPQLMAAVRASSESLRAIVAGTGEGEAFRNSIMRGADPRLEGAKDQARTADAAEQSAESLEEIESSLAGLGGGIGLATISV
jgi:hypothetical protein